MVAEVNEKKEDFFDLIEQDQRIDDPFASDEIIFRDESGNLKVLRDGGVEDAQGEGKPEDSVKTEIVQKELKETKAAFELPQDLKTPKTKPTVDIEKEVAHVVEEIGIKFNDPDIEKRFKNIVKSSLKKVRSTVQSREIFTSPMTEGGMGFDPQVTGKIIDIIKKHIAHLDESLLKDLSKDESVAVQAQVDSAPKTVKKEAVRPQPTFAPNPTPDKSVIDRAHEAQEVKQEKIEKIASVVPKKPKVEPEPEPISMPQPIISDAPNKPKIQDIKFNPQLTGPIEEIRTLSLADFRRLSPDPRQAIEKIYEKINLLEEESFAKRTQAVAAWKESEVNRIYIELGDRSMEGSKSVADIITELQAAGEETLTNDELEAVVELNQKLRY